MQWRERAIREKQTAERAKNTADSQLDELNSQQADDPEGANAALRDTLNDIADKDLQIRDLQRQVTTTPQCSHCVLVLPHRHSMLALTSASDMDYAASLAASADSVSRHHWVSSAYCSQFAALCISSWYHQVAHPQLTQCGLLSSSQLQQSNSATLTACCPVTVLKDLCLALCRDS